MNRPKNHRSAPALIVVAGLIAAPAGAQNPVSARLTPLETLQRADVAARDALIAFLEDQASSRVKFPGQYTALGELHWSAEPLLRSWTVSPPEMLAVTRDSFRATCVRALRDCVASPSADLMSMLAAIADDVLESPPLRSEAQFALAQFGDRTRIDRVLDEARQRTAMEDAVNRARGWNTLGDTYYELRDYGAAADAQLRLLEMIESGQIGLRTGLPMRYYNSACALALAGRPDDAFVQLEKALATGRESGEQLALRLLQTDQDIVSLRGKPRFSRLIEQYFGATEPDRDP